MFKSKHKGIGYKSGPGRQKRWVARIMVHGKYHNIGHFMTEEEAIIAYKNFIEENKNNLPERAKNLTKNIEDVPRNSDGMIERSCSICGKMGYFEKVPLSDMCKSCGIKESFKHRPAVGLKELDLESSYKDYQSGMSLEEVGKKYGFSAGGLERKFKRNGYETRDYKEAAILTNEKYGNIKMGTAKIKEMCESGEFQKKMSAIRQGIPIEEWKRFFSDENQIFYRSPEYKEWRKAVLKRDNYTCQMCKIRGGELQSHHIKPKCKFPELKLEISNGVCLCHACHNLTKNNEQNFEEQFLKISV